MKISIYNLRRKKMSHLEDVYRARSKKELQRYERMRAEVMMRTAQRAGSSFLDSMFYGEPFRSQPSEPPDTKFKQLKKSVKQIEAEPFESGARKRIEGKINRLQSAGATAQATILEEELRTKDSLVRLKDWDYKLLTKQTIEKFQKDNKMTATRDGLKLHIDPLDKYCGNPEAGEAKDRIVPDNILEKLEEAKERELFDEFAVLWVEKVKDPLILGIVYGCEDFFFIAEWGNDVSFEQITKGE